MKSPRKADLVEALRKVVTWAECVSMDLPLEKRRNTNWRYLNEAREVLRKTREYP